MPRQAAELPDHLSILEPGRVESGASFYLTLHSSELAVSCLRKITKGAAPILLECVVELGTLNAGDQWHKICPRAGRSSLMMSS